MSALEHSFAGAGFCQISEMPDSSENPARYNLQGLTIEDLLKGLSTEEVLNCASVKEIKTYLKKLAPKKRKRK